MGMIHGIIVGVQEIKRAREGVTILMKDVWHSAVIGLSLHFHELCDGRAQLWGMLKKGRSSGMTWAGL